jgi:hypothetical protein
MKTHINEQEYEAEFRKRRWAVHQWGLREFDSVIEQRLTEHLHSRANATLSRDRLEQAAREQ